MMRNFNSRVPDVLEFISPPGDRIHVTYEPVFNGQSLSLKPSGEVDVQQTIEAYAPFCDLNYMLSRLKIGDTSVISSRPPIYGDFSCLPDNPIDAINLVHSAESRFLALSVDERQQYNNDYRVWLSSILASLGSADSGISPDPDSTLLDPVPLTPVSPEVSDI